MIGLKNNKNEGVNLLASNSLAIVLKVALVQPGPDSLMQSAQATQPKTTNNRTT